MSKRPDPILSVTWCCGYYYGPLKWQGTEYYEPDECGEVFSTETTVDEWESKCTFAACPKCKADLDQTYDCPELDLDVGGILRVVDEADCLSCGVGVGPLIVFPKDNQWTCPGCACKFGITGFEPVS